MNYYFIKYELDTNNLPFIITVHKTDNKWSFIENKEEKDFETSEEAEVFFQNYLSSNNILEIIEEKYNAALEKKLIWNESLNEFTITSFNDLSFEKQKEIVLKKLINNIKEYSGYIILDDDLKADIKRLRQDIKNSTMKSELLIAITELEVILQDLKEG